MAKRPIPAEPAEEPNEEDAIAAADAAAEEAALLGDNDSAEQPDEEEPADVGTTLILPTVGRVVWYIPGRFRLPTDVLEPDADDKPQPFAATVAYVTDNRTINISYVDHHGRQRAACGVRLLQEGDNIAEIEREPYCMWMPYQLGQAKKHAKE